MRNAVIVFLLVLNGLGGEAQGEEVIFYSQGLELHGTLTIPEGRSKVPLAILVHGSGPADRDQTVALVGPNAQCLYPDLVGETLHNFKDISDHLLTENCMAVLRYDKRTYTHKNLNPQEVVFDDFTMDIIAAIDYAVEHPRIDGDQIFLVGHSQGSALIPIAALRSGKVRGLVSLAGPTTGPDTLFVQQLQQLYTKCAGDTASAEEVARQLYPQFQQIREGAFRDDEQVYLSIQGTTLYLGYGRFWKSWFGASDHVLENYEQSGLPLLVVQGQEDFNVPWEDARDFLSLSNPGGTEVLFYPGINHFLTPRDTPQVSQRVLDDMSDWLCLKATPSIDVHPGEWKVRGHSGYVCVESPENMPWDQVVVFSIDGRILSVSKDFRPKVILPTPGQGICAVQISSKGFSSTYPILLNGP